MTKAKPKRRDMKLNRITECVLINAATTAPKDISLKVTRTNEFASVPEAKPTSQIKAFIDILRLSKSSDVQHRILHH